VILDSPIPFCADIRLARVGRFSRWTVHGCAEHIALIRRISSEQPGWAEDRIAHELAIKLGMKHSTSTIRRYMVRRREPRGGQTWKTFSKKTMRARSSPWTS